MKPLSISHSGSQSVLEPRVSETLTGKSTYHDAGLAAVEARLPK